MEWSWRCFFVMNLHKEEGGKKVGEMISRFSSLIRHSEIDYSSFFRRNHTYTGQTTNLPFSLFFGQVISPLAFTTSLVVIEREEN